LLAFRGPGSSASEVTVDLAESEPEHVSAERSAGEIALLGPQDVADADALEVVRAAAHELGGAADLASAARALLSRAAAASGAERATLALARSEGGTLRLAPTFGWRAPGAELAPILLSRTLAARVLDSKLALSVPC